MSAAKAPLGFGLYFIDVLACMLFSITLALATARFDSEQHVAVQLPSIEDSEHSSDAAPQLGAQWVTLREEASGMQLYLGEEPVTLAALSSRFRAAPPPALILRSEASVLAEVIGMAHAAGVADVQLAYEVSSQEGEQP
jgi:biopolymer transport protein ExbD